MTFMGNFSGFAIAKVSAKKFPVRLTRICHSGPKRLIPLFNFEGLKPKALPSMIEFIFQNEIS
jgi:hypothetical protein